MNGEIKSALMEGGLIDPYISLLGNIGRTCDYETNEMNQLCRLCARHCSEEPGCSFDIENEKKKLLHMIKTCLPIDVDTCDPYPKRICLDCNNYLQLLFQFHNTAIQAQEIFKLKMPYSNYSNSTKIFGSRRINTKKNKSSPRRETSSDDSDLLEETRNSPDQDVNNSAEINDIRNKRGFSKRRVWSSVEKAVMTKHFSSYLKNGTLPSFHLCSIVRQMNPILHNRSNSIMKAWVYNQQKRQRERNKDFFDAK